jgi:hypothetical protein
VFAAQLERQYGNWTLQQASLHPEPPVVSSPHFSWAAMLGEYDEGQLPPVVGQPRWVRHVTRHAPGSVFAAQFDSQYDSWTLQQASLHPEPPVVSSPHFSWAAMLGA